MASVWSVWAGAGWRWCQITQQCGFDGSWPVPSVGRARVSMALSGRYVSRYCVHACRLLGCCGSALCGVTQQKQHCFQWDCCSCFQDELVVCSELGWCSGLVLSKLGLCAAALSVLVVHSGGCHALGRLGTGSLSSAYLQGMPLTSGQLKVGVCWGLDCAAQCGANPQCLSVQVPAGSTAVCVAAQQKP